MPAKSLELLFQSERRSYLHLVSHAWRQSKRFCVRCRSSKVYRLADKRFRCGNCGYTFHDFTRRWIGELNLSARQWLWVVKLFELEIPPAQMAKEVGISYPTALKAIYLIRRAIAHAGVRDESPVAESTDAPTGAEDSSGVFGLIEERGGIRAVKISGVDSQDVLQEHPTLVRQGPVVFTGPYGRYDAVLLWRPRLPAGVAWSAARAKPSLGGMDAFWNFARVRLAKFHRTSDQDFYYFLRELVFRFEHRDQEIFDELVGMVTCLMPND